MQKLRTLSRPSLKFKVHLGDIAGTLGFKMKRNAKPFDYKHWKKNNCLRVSC